MERDSAISHGVAAFLRERLCGVSDEYPIIVCTKCCTIADTEMATASYTCRKCGNASYLANTKIPYAFKYLVQTLAPAGLNVELECRTEADYAESRNSILNNDNNEDEADLGEDEEEEEEVEEEPVW